MTTQPVATVLVIERRICRCGAVYDAPSPNLHTLMNSCRGFPMARSIERLPLSAIAPLSDRRTLYVKEVHVPNCQLCWQTDLEWFDAITIVPPRPRIIVESEIHVVKKNHVPTLDEL